MAISIDSKSHSSQNNKVTLEEAYPELVAEWHPTKNGDKTPADFYPKSNKKAWWLGSCGHEWCAVIASRTNGIGCPICSGRIPEVGVNDLATTHPELAKEWDYDRNKGLTPKEVKAGSHKKVWWKCSKGHHFVAPPYRRATGDKTGCPICSGRIPDVGVNDLATVNPSLAAEWHPTKNGNKGPQDFLPKSNKKVWWRHWCEEANMWHEWDETISNRAAGTGCPFCSNHRLLVGYNDLQTRYPELAKEWHPAKNAPLTPSSIVYSSRKNIWWRCEYGHEWRVSPANRVSKDKITGCPVCNGEHGTSFPEQAILFYLRRELGDLVESRALVGDQHVKREADIYIPNQNIAIEYDGEFWHKNRSSSDKDKAALFRKNDIRLFKVIESDRNEVVGDCVYYKVQWRDLSNLDWAIRTLFRLMDIDEEIVVDTKKDQLDILKRFKQDKSDRGLANLYPDLAKEWVSEKNNGLMPNQFTPGSLFEVVWRCPKCKSEYSMSIQNRVKGYACPFCAKKKTIVGKTDLATTRPELLKWWAYDLNKDVDPTEVFAGSAKKYWWRSPEGGEPFESTPERMSKGNRPRLIVGLNDLKTLYPEIAEEWDQEKNGDKTLESITARNSKKVWWKCKKCGFEWRAAPRSRVLGYGQCPNCRSVSSLYPELMKEWDYDRNQGIDPKTTTPHSDKKVYWKHWCESASMWHSWKAAIQDRTSGTGCPYCANKKVLAGFNDLATTHPDLAKEWHPSRNKGITPKMVTAGSSKKVWWLGPCGHEWCAHVYSRSMGTGCPICNKK